MAPNEDRTMDGESSGSSTGPPSRNQGYDENDRTILSKKNSSNAMKLVNSVVCRFTHATVCACCWFGYLVDKFCHTLDASVVLKFLLSWSKGSSFLDKLAEIEVSYV